MAGRGSAPGERRGGREKGVPNKPTFDTRTVFSPDGQLTPLKYMLGILNDPDMPDKDRKWAARAAMPYVHPKLRAALADTLRGVTVEIRQFTDEEALAELDALGEPRTLAKIEKNNREQSQPVEQAPTMVSASTMDRMEAEWFNPDSRHVAHEPALPSPAPTPPQPPVPALGAAPVPCETRPIHRANGNGAHRPPQRVNGHLRRVNGAVVRRSDDEIRNISGRPREIRDYPPTHPVHGIV